MKITIEDTGYKETLDLDDYGSIEDFTEALLEELEKRGIDLEVFYEENSGWM